MKKLKTSTHHVKCNLKQMDICTAFKNWKSIKKDKTARKIMLPTSTEVIEILDSDSDQTLTSDEVLPKKKRRLAVPLPDNEEESKSVASVEGNAYPKTKRPLKLNFDDEEDDTRDELDGCTEIVESDDLATLDTSIGTPAFHSTPLSALNVDANSNSYIVRNDIEETYLTQSETVDNLSAISREDPEQTIVFERNQQRTIEIKQHVVIPPRGGKYSRNVTKSIPQHSNYVANQDAKRRDRNGDCNEVLENGSGGESDTSPTVAIPVENSASINDVTQKASTSKNVPQWLSKKSKPNLKSVQKQSEKAAMINKSSAEPSQNRVNGNNLETTPRKLKPVTPETTPKKASPKTVTTPNNSPLKTEKKKMNQEPLKLIKELFATVSSSKHVGNLLDSERKMINIFRDMNVQYQYACLKLITRQRKWYNAFKFCRLINLDMEETDISDMMNSFQDNGIIETNYINESVMSLLHHLDRTDLKYICNKFRLNKTLSTKESMVQALLKYTGTQSTLTVRKTTKDVLIDEIQNRMGRCIRLSEEFRDAFFSMYVLGTFTNADCSNMNDYFTNMLYHKVVFPEFPIDDYVIFGSRNDFISYVRARKYRDELEKLTDPLECLQICETVFTNLRSLGSDKSDEERFRETPHLIRFTAKAVYVSTLSFMTDKLFCKFPYEVRRWLEYMIKRVDCPHKIGHWYNYLIWLYMRYLQPFDYDRAAQLLIHVLLKKKEHLSEVQLYTLFKRGQQLINTRKYKILPIHHDCIVQLLPKPLRECDFPERTVDAKTIRSNDLGKKRNYEVRDEEGNRTIYKVEYIALKHYLERLDYTDGEHCEGTYIRALFTLFFFDVIYQAKTVIPGTFVSKIQSVPLDMNSRYFYPNRKQEIDQRLREIEGEWSDEQVLKFAKNQYQKHSHEYAVCEVGAAIKDVELLEDLIECIGRRVLGKIFERLVKNFREYRSGLPDLLVWNADRKECKFVEVKGENDKLSVGQTLWLDYLLKNGANIEVCHVHSTGSKRKVKKVEGKVQQEASTSSRSD